MTDQIQLWIAGWPPSMKNSRQLVRNRSTNKPMVIKSDKAQAWWDAALQQITGDKKLGWGSADDPLRITCHVWYRNKRPDLDCSIVLDLLQEVGVISNDRYVYEFHQYKHFVTADPHMQDGVHITIERVYTTVQT